ncbi:MAG: amino acid-binding protein [Anaerosomatales bacterium]
MKVRQLSVFIANEAGRVSEVTDLLGSAGVNIRGFAVSDTAEYGILRLIVDKPDDAKTALKHGGFTVKESDVICINLPDKPGGLASVLKIVAAAGVNIEYVYSLIATYVVINVGDADRALRLLEGQPVQLVSQKEIASIRCTEEIGGRES